jgi:hypothetical protein
MPIADHCATMPPQASIARRMTTFTLERRLSSPSSASSAGHSGFAARER